MAAVTMAVFLKGGKEAGCSGLKSLGSLVAGNVQTNFTSIFDGC